MYNVINYSPPCNKYLNLRSRVSIEKLIVHKLVEKSYALWDPLGYDRV
jgi:hypothetical protein